MKHFREYSEFIKESVEHRFCCHALRLGSDYIDDANKIRIDKGDVVEVECTINLILLLI